MTHLDDFKPIGLSLGASRLFVVGHPHDTLLRGAYLDEDMECLLHKR